MASDEQIRLDCLRLAHERLGPKAGHKLLFAEADRLFVYIKGFDEIGKIGGLPAMGKRL